MSLDNASEKCAVCKAYLFSEDDVVYCPECGAPHHRECYNSIGHCGLEEFHGTENQYQRTQPEEVKQENKDNNYITCEMCGEKYECEEPMCPNCSTPNMVKTGVRFVKIDLTGGVSDDVDLGDGVTAKDAKKFVFSNTHRYLPKFLSFKNGKKASWNWLAFLTPCGWLLSRKMYLLGCVVGALQIAAAMFTMPFVKGVNMLDTSGINNYMEYSNLIVDNVALIGDVALYSAFIASIIDLIIRIILGIFGDYIYKNRVVIKVAEIKKAQTDSFEEFYKKGGVNIFAAILGYFAVAELPTIIAYTIGML